MDSLIRTMETPITAATTINVRGAMSDSDSSGRNPYFALQLQEEADRREKESHKPSGDSVEFAELSEFCLIPPQVKEVPLSDETLHRISSTFLVAFIPFQVPISLQ